jgi:hypothetical protein
MIGVGRKTAGQTLKSVSFFRSPEPHDRERGVMAEARGSRDVSEDRPAVVI